MVEQMYSDKAAVAGPPVLFTTTRSRLRTAVGVCKRIITRSTVLIVPYAAQKA